MVEELERMLISN